MTPAELFALLGEVPRIRLAHLPTPLEPLPGLSRRLRPCSVWAKRDDQTGLAFGGNKARKLEHILADVAAHGADSIVTWAGIQSNWCRQVAAAAARLGIRPVLVLLRKPGLPVEEDGNLLLNRLFGADIRVVDAPEGKSFLELENIRDLVDPVLDEERAAGRRPYLAPVGGSLMEGDLDRPLGALGYVRAFAEIMEQAGMTGFTPDWVVLATGSAGTQAGLVVGAKLLSPSTRILGISVAGTAETVSGYVKRIGDAILAELGIPGEVAPEEVAVVDDYLADGYGVLNPEITRAIGLLARDEGLLLDPVYTGKAMWGLLDLAHKSFFPGESRIVFLHTGGTPALFPYRNGLREGLNG